MKYEKLSVEDRDRMMQQLNTEQKEYVKEMLTRGRRTTFANVLARQKGIVIPHNATFAEIEQILDEWIYFGYHDAGQVSSKFRCECGRPLRYQHIVMHKTTQETKKLGINHLKEHLNIDAKAVQEILNGFDAIDYELDEILTKIERNWSMDPILSIRFYSIVIPKDIQLHMDMNLPLLDKQVDRLRNLIREAEQTPIVIKEVKKQWNKKPIFNTANEHHEKQISFSMDGDDTLHPKITPSTSDTKQHCLLLNEEQERYVLKLLQDGFQSTRIICESMIQEGLFPDKRFITGKPTFYAEVCLFIDRHVNLGHCCLLEKDQIDRKYKWNHI